MSALKYIYFFIDFEERNIHFLTISDSETDLKNFKKYLTKNEVNIYGNTSSKDRWKFSIDTEIQSTSNNNGASLDFISNDGEIDIENIDLEVWDEFRNYVVFEDKKL
ncbi:hypothetical protein B5F09_06175 [Erysipelatoclostridium sp. An173]|uniref:hypothetical protein n=1 Tax=Erysipelatoclostridium sp. An173 TaxID=1965571 RepID=UPI000B3AFA05|nr:hypothetical protein [Erysipelatoclostridium sp. An173]OUP77366.1 hypothetical protein B5F09_06175 [Erysipelatoclostridium sp. An173]